jgi:hypothetical protein
LHEVTVMFQSIYVYTVRRGGGGLVWIR